MPVRKLSNRPLQTQEQRNQTYGRGYAYARGILENPGQLETGGRMEGPPYSRITAQTLLQHAWRDGYIAALRDVRAGKVSP